ncbi:hypothetical protein HDU93_002992 [Gonapodya sp. JEL0774]|nr:hypothetical protein HDU93_002992 [Gonapodya sp. JEL0774]
MARIVIAPLNPQIRKAALLHCISVASANAIMVEPTFLDAIREILPDLRIRGIKVIVWENAYPFSPEVGVDTSIFELDASGKMVSARRGVSDLADLVINEGFLLKGSRSGTADSRIKKITYATKVEDREYPSEDKLLARGITGNGMRADVFKRFYDRFGIPEIVEFYAASDGTSLITNHYRGGVEGIGSVGRRGPLVTRILNGPWLVKVDEITEQPIRNEKGLCILAKPGEAGECIGPWIPGAIRYRNNDAATEKKVLRDVFKKGDAYWRMGDLLSRDNHYWYSFVDRLGDTFRWKSENVSTFEVGNFIGQHPSVQDANVFGLQGGNIDRRESGRLQRRLQLLVISVPNHVGRAGAAVIVLRPEFQHLPKFKRDLLMEDLGRHCLKVMPRFAVPIFIRLLPEVELTSSMKHRKVEYQKEGYGKADYWLPPHGMSTHSSLTVDPALVHLRSLAAVRDTTTRLLNAALATPGRDGKGFLKHFTLDESKIDDVVDFILGLMKRDYPSSGGDEIGKVIDGISVTNIPPHSRWRHFDAGGIKRLGWLLQSWKSTAMQSSEDPLEPARRALDLTFVSVLLDAGAGDTWKYVEQSSYGDEHPAGETYTRSEGLAIVSVDMFRKGLFSSDATDPCRVDAAALRNLPLSTLATCCQHNPTANPLAGLEGRHSLLTRLGEALDADKEVFGRMYSGVRPDGTLYATVAAKFSRPGNILDWLLCHTSASHYSHSTSPVATVHLTALWEALTSPAHGFSTIWPASRTKIAGVPMGDVWKSEALSQLPASSWVGDAKEAIGERTDNFVAFHKLTQWLVYSVVEVVEKCGVSWVVEQDGKKIIGSVIMQGTDDLTGLAEYRNGGLFVDMGVIKPLTLPSSALPPSHPIIVEWRALTVPLLDLVAIRIRERLGVTKVDLPLAKVLEGGTWKGGREVAKKLRGDKGSGPPIGVAGDGTIF